MTPADIARSAFDTRPRPAVDAGHERTGGDEMETTMAHTPGPWTLDRADIEPSPLAWPADWLICKEYAASETSSMLARIPGAGGEANARLMAAAPDLLEACQHTLLWLAKWVVPADAVGQATICLLEAAIAKAEGTNRRSERWNASH